MKILDEEILGLAANPRDHTVLVSGASTRLLVDYLSGDEPRAMDFWRHVLT